MVRKKLGRINQILAYPKESDGNGGSIVSITPLEQHVIMDPTQLLQAFGSLSRFTIVPEITIVLGTNLSLIFCPTAEGTVAYLEGLQD